ncbi:MAG: hypothetical protein CM1200mP25_2960 [Acidobacteriota bacterium]|nr:MAG: hypothetical protein CM1200mP25_2960 [Acidobacteriota bacterium]
MSMTDGQLPVSLRLAIDALMDGIPQSAPQRVHLTISVRPIVVTLDVLAQSGHRLTALHTLRQGYQLHFLRRRQTG